MWRIGVRKLVTTGRVARISAPAAAPRRLPTSSVRAFSDTVKVTFVDKDGDSETVDAEVGSNFLDIAHDNDIEVEGACGGEMACSTCHMIFDKTTYGSLPEPEEEEEDMLDLALGLTETSRLGCQIICTKEMDGITINLPSETSNMQG